MSNRIKTRKKRQAMAREISAKTRIMCPNCGKEGAHFIPPSSGWPGFYICGSRDAK